MGTISVSLPSDGQTIDAADVNNPINTIVTAINGNLDNNNISAGGVATSNLATGIQVSTKEQVPYKFSVYRTAALSTANNAAAVVAFDTKTYDTGTNVDVVTNKGRFTAPISGFYTFSSSMSITAGGTITAYIMLYKNGAEVKRGTAMTVGASAPGYIISTDLQLTAADYVEVAIFCSATSGFNVTAPLSYFDGHLISAT